MGRHAAGTRGHPEPHAVVRRDRGEVGGSVDLTGSDEPRRLMASVVSPGLHRQLGIRPLLGRVFDAGDGRGSAGPVVLLGEKLWRAAFGADERIAGRSVALNRRPYTVVGVLPANEGFSDHADLWLAVGPDEVAQPQDRRYRLVAHLAPGATIDAANRELEVLSAALVRDVRRLVWEVEPALPLHWNDLFADLIARTYWQPRAPRARRDPCACG